jgi:hypothetical protein
MTASRKGSSLKQKGEVLPMETLPRAGSTLTLLNTDRSRRALKSSPPSPPWPAMRKTGTTSPEIRRSTCRLLRELVPATSSNDLRHVGATRRSRGDLLMVRECTSQEKLPLSPDLEAGAPFFPISSLQQPARWGEEDHSAPDQETAPDPDAIIDGDLTPHPPHLHPPWMQRNEVEPPICDVRRRGRTPNQRTVGPKTTYTTTQASPPIPTPSGRAAGGEEEVRRAKLWRSCFQPPLMGERRERIRFSRRMTSGGLRNISKPGQTSLKC